MTLVAYSVLWPNIHHACGSVRKQVMMLDDAQHSIIL